MSYLNDVAESDPWGNGMNHVVNRDNMTNSSPNLSSNAVPTTTEDLTQRLFGSVNISTDNKKSNASDLQPPHSPEHSRAMSVPISTVPETVNDNDDVDPWTQQETTVWGGNDPIAENNHEPNKGDNNNNITNNSDADLQDWIGNVRRTYHPLQPNIITIEEIPEREGLLFKHTNYNVMRLQRLANEDVSHEDDTNVSMSVVRRYSDFVWLQDVLLKRYPFRLIPELPPKKLGSQNLDPIFLNKRRLGLIRFINHVVRHPILKNDDLLLTFLTVPTDISNWRKQTRDNYDTSDEFIDSKIEPSFIKLWSNNISEQWNDVATNILKIIDTWHKITLIIQRHERRLNQINQENVLLNNLIDDFTQLTPVLYPIENINNDETLPEINNNLSIIKTHLIDCKDLNLREMDDNVNSILPKLKNFIDLLIALKNLFERYKIMATNNIPQLQRHVQLNMEKLEAMKGKPDASGIEYDKIKNSIHRDRRSITKQINRAWLIRKCILHEFTIFQETQFMISDLFKKWVQLNSNYNELNMNQWEKLSSQIMDIPLGR